MTDLPDWAKDRAREWCEQMRLSAKHNAPSLAALLVEVKEGNSRGRR